MITGSNTFVWSRPWSHSSKSMQSLRGRRLEGKGKGVLCARETLSMQRVPYVQIPNYPFAHRPGYLPLNILHNFCFSFLLGIAAVPREIACVASVSVWFRSKERLRNGILGFGRARNETSAKKRKWGEREGVSFLSSPPPLRSFTCAIFRTVFDSRSSFFAPRPHGNACYAGWIDCPSGGGGGREGVWFL